MEEILYPYDISVTLINRMKWIRYRYYPSSSSKIQKNVKMLSFPPKTPFLLTPFSVSGRRSDVVNFQKAFKATKIFAQTSPGPGAGASITSQLLLVSRVFFCCIRVIYFSYAYVLLTPLQCPPTPGSCVLICLRAPTLTVIFSILPTRPAFGASVGSAFCLVFSCFAHAGLGLYGHLVPIKVAPNWRDDRPKGLKGAKSWQCLRDAYAKPARRTGYKCCLLVCLSVCLFVCWPSFLSFPSNSMPSNSIPSNSVPSISHLQHSLRR